MTYPSAPLEESSKPVILVVEDSKTQAEMLVYLLEESGFKPIVASDGRDAIERMTYLRPHLILTDIVMPRMDGYELCQWIRKNESTKNIPVILVTQLYDPEDIIKGISSGADNFIIKPYEPDMLIRRIHDALRFCRERKNIPETGDVEITYKEKRYMVHSSKLQILQVLLSSYETAVQKNGELIEAQSRLHDLNNTLEKHSEDLSRLNDELNSKYEEIEQAHNALSRANKALQLMNSITRHDVLNQVMAINGYAWILSERPAEPAVLQEKLGNIKQASEQIRDIIEFTKNYQDLGTDKPIWYRVDTILRIPAIEKMKEHLVVKLQTGSLEIFADRMIEKVFFNLIDNTLRHGKNATRVVISADQYGDDLLLIYEDDGVGVPEAEKALIFKRGYGKNTGLGLFLIKEILDLTNITITENGTAGTRFEMLVPSGCYRFSDR